LFSRHGTRIQGRSWSSERLPLGGKDYDRGYDKIRESVNQVLVGDVLIGVTAAGLVGGNPFQS
jgi:hypothetical protein